MKKTKQIWIVRILLVALIFCVFPIQAGAETVYNGYTINTDYVLIFTPYEGFGTTTIAHFNEALSRWNYAAGLTLMRREPTVRHQETTYPLDDDKSYIFKSYDARGYLGVTALFKSKLSKVLRSVDINLNTMYAFANSGISGCYDVWSVFIHEAGHAAGLYELYEQEHSNCVMYYTVAPGVERRELTLYDGTNIQNLYS